MDDTFPQPEQMQIALSRVVRPTTLIRSGLGAPPPPTPVGPNDSMRSLGQAPRLAIISPDTVMLNHRDVGGVPGVFVPNLGRPLARGGPPIVPAPLSEERSAPTIWAENERQFKETQRKGRYRISELVLRKLREAWDRAFVLGNEIYDGKHGESRPGASESDYWFKSLVLSNLAPEMVEVLADALSHAATSGDGSSYGPTVTGFLWFLYDYTECKYDIDQLVGYVEMMTKIHGGSGKPGNGGPPDNLANLKRKVAKAKEKAREYVKAHKKDKEGQKKADEKKKEKDAERTK